MLIYLKAKERKSEISPPASWLSHIFANTGAGTGPVQSQWVITPYGFSTLIAQINSFEWLPQCAGAGSWNQEQRQDLNPGSDIRCRNPKQLLRHFTIWLLLLLSVYWGWL